MTDMDLKYDTYELGVQHGNSGTHTVPDYILSDETLHEVYEDGRSEGAVRDVTYTKQQEFHYS